MGLGFRAWEFDLDLESSNIQQGSSIFNTVHTSNGGVYLERQGNSVSRP